MSIELKITLHNLEQLPRCKAVLYFRQRSGKFLYSGLF